MPAMRGDRGSSTREPRSMSMRGFIILAAIFLMAAQVPALAPERYSWKWVVSGTLLTVGMSCILAGILIGMLEE